MGVVQSFVTGGIGSDQYWSDLFLSAFTHDHPVIQEYQAQVVEQLEKLPANEREALAVRVAQQMRKAGAG